MANYKIELGPDHVGPHLKVYLKDISLNPQIKDQLEGLAAVHHVNITEKRGKSDLTVYPNKAYDITEVRDEVATFLDGYFGPGSALSSPAPVAGPRPTPAPAATPAGDPAVPAHLTVFLSYSWDDDPVHQAWVLALADRLQSQGGVKVLRDQYEIRAGKSITHFMETSVVAADKVVMIMTPNYKEKADGRKGGVGFEYSMISAELYASQVAGKFIPVARKGKYLECSPTFIKGLKSLDMTSDAEFEAKFWELLREIHDEPYVTPPPIGPKPVFPIRIPATGPAAVPPSAPGLPAGAAPPATSLVDDADNMARSRMPAVAHWSFNISVKSMVDLSLSNFYRQIYSHRISQEAGRYYLPLVLNDYYKKSHHPDWDFVIPLNNGGIANMFEASALKITKGNIRYEYSEYSTHEMMLLRLTDPFMTLLYLLLILKAGHDELGRQPTIEIEIDFKSNRKTVFYLQHSPIPVSRVYGLQTMTIPGNEASRTVVIAEVNQNSLMDVFGELYAMFMAENPGSNLPYIELDRTAFLKAIKELISQ
ncbi:hypothetical protein DCC81_03890 [Chitinophaga parva]|uniref:SEFIR domain-containing protein n=1 Tax=Chitinophaga parva TaxID=2169414 RepID=A0A2T7BLS7_9BACT|nr:toll/interleukin-1 receptor domain-containing protein [Chitinophaga parva]PUZ28635.1 hypothetical protein DCC81_03890 [Chitinophaga parva]